MAWSISLIQNHHLHHLNYREDRLSHPANIDPNYENEEDTTTRPREFVSNLVIGSIRSRRTTTIRNEREGLMTRLSVHFDCQLL